MEKPASNPVHLQLSPLTDKEFAGFQKLIYEWAGIHMNESKKALVSGRLMKRLRHYNISTFSDYLRIVKGSEFPEEKQIMINLLTTNETYFFREPKHFDWLRQKIRTRNTAEKFRLWSAASSSGQEAYTIAMVIAEEMGPHGWEILGSDISERALSVAINATYPIEQASQIPERYLKRFCLKGVRESEGKFCIRPEILQNIRFFRVNLNEALPQNFGLSMPALIFLGLVPLVTRVGLFRLDRWWAVAWFVGVVGGAVIFGERWVRATDPFEVFAERIATLSPWQRVDGVLHLVNPLRHACTAATPRGTAAVTATLLGITAYDSFTSTTIWVGWVQTSSLPRTVWGTLGLLGMTLLVGGAFALAARATAAGWTDRLAASLVPIVVGYNVAHYLSLLVLEGQRTAILASDPLGLGWNVFGTAELGVNTGIFDYPQTVAVIQLCAIVLGHLLGVLIAHDRSLVALNGRRVVAGQLPMLVLMVGYTVAGLVLLFSP